jgi:uncharacterized protein (TIGR02246 family)
MSEPSIAVRTAIEAIVGELETAWNAGDGTAFGAPFAEDADFVNVRGEHARSREAIATGHVGIFRSIYAGSRVTYTVESVRLLRPDVALVHARGELDAPAGPLAGRHASRFSMVVTKEHGGWQVASFHNTLEAPTAPPR